MLRIALVVLFALTLTACTNSDATTQTLEKAGYTEIQVTGWKMFRCSDDDTYSTGFKATNSNGQVVEGTVCCGMVVKGCTIRF